MKRCSKCGEEKPRDAFWLRSGGPSLQSWCKSCTNAQSKERYQRPEVRSVIVARQAKNYEEFREWLWELKSRPCEDCGGTFHPACMQFDHIPNRGKKLFGISTGVAVGRTRESVVAEIAKCKLRCANCHAYVTHVERPDDER